MTDVCPRAEGRERADPDNVVRLTAVAGIPALLASSGGGVLYSCSFSLADKALTLSATQVKINRFS